MHTTITDGVKKQAFYKARLNILFTHLRTSTRFHSKSCQPNATLSRTCARTQLKFQASNADCKNLDYATMMARGITCFVFAVLR